MDVFTVFCDPCEYDSLLVTSEQEAEISVPAVNAAHNVLVN